MQIPTEPDNIDGLGYLEGKTMDYVNTKAYEAVVAAPTDGGVPVMTVHIPREDEYTFRLPYLLFEVCDGNFRLLKWY